MNQPNSIQYGLRLVVVVSGLIATSLPAAPGDPPTFYLIEQFGKNFGQVLLHFDTQANRQYELQYSTNLLALKGQAPANDWKVVYTVQAIPFDNHYVILDGSTNENRFYRLLATP
jgi:hypothetical protein